MAKRFFYKNFILVLAADILLVAFSWYLAYLLRFNFLIPPGFLRTLVRFMPVVLVIKIPCFYFFQLYNGMWRYTSLTDLGNILKAGSFSSLTIICVVLFGYGFAGFSRSIFIIDWALTLILISGCRVGIRLYFLLYASQDPTGIARMRFFSGFFRKNNKGKKLLIIGAGDCGEKLLREIRDNPQLGHHVVGLIDDHPTKANLQIHGVPVMGKTSEVRNVAEKTGAEELLIAIPSASYRDMRKIVAFCDESGLPFKTVPGISELINGKVSVKAIRDVAYKDLLGRKPVELNEELIGNYLEGARVLVTGAGGSIGSELCRQVCRFKPRALILLERAESPLYEIELELKQDFPHMDIVPKLSDVCDRHQVLFCFESHRPQVVFHAAAYKHVPMLEIQPWKAIKNNILGTRNIIDFSRQFSVERFVFVSTDKAVRPTSVMGASKRVSELFVHGQNGFSMDDEKYMVVRFGNVVGSVGSVVPLFRKQIASGGPVTVTHPEVTRYFMTIPEACQLILQAGAMGNGGETFVLDMGTPVKISDMARDLIRLSGYEPDVDIKIEYIGLRPGEKLYEELITDGEGIRKTGHKKIMVLRGQSCDMPLLNGHIDDLSQLADAYDSLGIRAKLREIVPEFKSMDVMDFERSGGIVKGGMPPQAFSERRRERRFRPKNGSNVSPNFDGETKCRIIDISRRGLSFYYQGVGDYTQDSAGLALELADDGCIIDKIPCRLISRRSANPSSRSDNNETERLSVMFGELTQNQKDRLDNFIKHHTVPL